MEASTLPLASKTCLEAKPWTPLAAPQSPAKARAYSGTDRRPSYATSPAHGYLRDKPASEPAGKLATATTGPAPTPDRGSAVAVPVHTTAQLCQNPTKNLQNRARSKYVTDSIVAGLMGLGERTPLRFAYASTARCAAELVQDGTQVKGKYCRQRWCLVCNRIRTAKLMAAYLPEMATWDDPHFVTLTIPNVEGHELHDAIRKMLKTVPRLARAIRRTDGLEYKAVRKLETTYSPKVQNCGRDYHPHLHLIVNSNAVADALVRRWLKANPDAVAKAQDVRRCAGKGAMSELFKYFTKLIVKGSDGKRTAPPAQVFDTMFKAVKGLRTFQPMGFVSQVKVNADDEALELEAGTVSPIKPDARGLIRWQWIGEDWMDYGSGELLSGFTPSDSIRELVKRITTDARAAPDF